MSIKDPLPTSTTRISIQWDDEVPEEQTSTLVLTAPSGIFVDLRVFLDWLPDVSHAHISQPSTAVDWAFAGMASHQPGPSGTNQTRSTWKHWVDSRTLDALNVHDTGVSVPLPNGDTCERGEMKDASGVLRTYQEVWRDLCVESACACPKTTAVFVLIRDGRCPEENAAARGTGVHPGNVNPEGVDGVLIRVGGWCQGVLRDASGFTAERWMFAGTGTGTGFNASNDSDTTWKPVFRSGQGYIPCLEACCLSLSSGSGAIELSTSSGLWRCIEIHEEISVNVDLSSWNP